MRRGWGWFLNLSTCWAHKENFCLLPFPPNEAKHHGVITVCQRFRRAPFCILGSSLNLSGLQFLHYKTGMWDSGEKEGEELLREVLGFILLFVVSCGPWGIRGFISSLTYSINTCWATPLYRAWVNHWKYHGEDNMKKSDNFRKG